MPGIITTHKHVSPLIVVLGRRGLSCSPAILELQRPNTAFCLFFSSPPTTTPPHLSAAVAAAAYPHSRHQPTSVDNERRKHQRPLPLLAARYVNLRSQQRRGKGREKKEDQRNKCGTSTSRPPSFVFPMFPFNQHSGRSGQGEREVVSGISFSMKWGAHAVSLPAPGRITS